LRNAFTALAALLLKPRSVVVPILLLVRALVTPGLIFEPLGVLWIDNCVQGPDD
jgi:hypothetical protein